MLVPDFETIPAYEAVKIFVVTKLQEITKAYSEIMQYMDMGKYPRTIVAYFKSETLSFFAYLRPKIYDIIAKDSAYRNLIDFGDKFTSHPRKFRLQDAIQLYLGLNQFCEDYRLTSTTYYRGRTSESEGGVY